MAEPAASVIIPARDAGVTLGRTLAAVADQDLTRDFEVIVVDDGSRDDTVAIAERAGARVIRQRDLGPGEARNAGARAARARALAFTDADCFPERTWLRAGLAALEGADLVQGRVLPDPSARRRPFDHTIWVVKESGLYETANLLVRREAFERVGGFEDWLDVDIGKRLGEDLWFGWKVRRAGGRTTFAPDALVYHAVFPRRWYEFVDERRRLLYFPALVQKVPELRRHFLKAGLFVTWRSAAFEVALAAIAVAGGLTAAGAWKLALVALVGALPYLSLVARQVVTHGRFGPRVALAGVFADAVGFVALVRGSARARRFVL